MRDQVVIDVPQKLIDDAQKLTEPGQSIEALVAFQVLDQGSESFFDARILADIPPPALASTVLGLTDIVDRQLPKLPLNNVSVACPIGPQEISVSYKVEATGANTTIKINQELDRFRARFIKNKRNLFDDDC